MKDLAYFSDVKKEALGILFSKTNLSSHLKTAILDMCDDDYYYYNLYNNT